MLFFCCYFFCIKHCPVEIRIDFTARSPFLSLWEIVAVYGGKLTKVVRLCPGLLTPALLMEEGGREVGEGADTVPLGTFSPSLSFSLSFCFFVVFFNSIHPLKTTTYEVAKCF